MRISFIPLIGAALVLGACNYKPLVAPSEPIVNSQLKSTNHWERLAAQTADQLTAALKEMPDEAAGSHMIDGKGMPRTMASRPVYVAGDRNSPFVAGFSDFLTTELTKRGYFVATTPANAVIVNTSTQVYAMSDPSKPPFPGSWVVAPAGYYGARMFEKTTLGLGGAAAAAAVPYLAIDTIVWFLVSPDTEVVITTTVLDDQRFLFRKASIFYVDDAEAAAYQAVPSNMITNVQSAPVELITVRVSSD